MSNIKQIHSLLLLFTFFLVAHVIQGSRTQVSIPFQHGASHFPPSNLQVKEAEMKRRIMIGSTWPTCTYNECRGCKHRCSAEQVPVEGNDPINSAYHYKCVCHRS
ncbi:EPIDERMAL PATTERNING FACTOR-like protein 9 [Hibiscus syriacus]|uniref:EPIDERMAL PATTERNING FACTOR-like protein 9 n=1 Tax=Hibiscus syriacus TaxID=106335 RepID=UPI0019246DF3|nr:EPIDERMAL PATTERNING FACTOR-like protein 9 [Hibiscus syriacus]